MTTKKGHSLAGRSSLKSDESFLKNISIGAIGTKRVFEHLQQQGHTPVELERGSMSFKLWTASVKTKRTRFPDILCTACNRRVESRAKTKLELSMSHSRSDPERRWDYGLNDNDFIAFIGCHRVGEKPIDWEADQLVQYVPVEEMRLAQRNDLIRITKEKGSQEGSEIRVIWASGTASADGVITRIDDRLIQYRRLSDNRAIRVFLKRDHLTLQPLVREGEVVKAHQVLASIVPVVQSFPCPKTATAQDYISQLNSPSLSERYAATKALSYFKTGSVTQALLQTVADQREHFYVRLEAAAGLFRQEDKSGITFIENCLSDEFLANRLEAVIVLGEVGTKTARTLLSDTLTDGEQDPEIRAGAAWALGELREKSALKTLIASFLAVEEVIRVEAARALAKLAREFTREIATQFPESDPETRPGIAWALSKSSQFTIGQMLNSLVDDDARRWVAYIIGTQNQERYINEIEALRLKDPEVYFAVTVLWQIMSSWVYNLEEY